jgi:hypothetical protein
MPTSTTSRWKSCYSATLRSRSFGPTPGCLHRRQRSVACLDRFPNLWVELAVRTDVAPGGTLDHKWRAVFLRHPDRFMVGTDTWVTARWETLVQGMQVVRGWLGELPREVAGSDRPPERRAVVRRALGVYPRLVHRRDVWYLPLSNNQPVVQHVWCQSGYTRPGHPDVRKQGQDVWLMQN